jgi:uncharacterized iron-regulated protein
MTSPALIQLSQLQQALYDKAYREAHAIVAGTSKTLLAYSEEFEQSLPRRFKRTTLTDLLERVRDARFVLYGDFHTLRQSQRGLLRLLRAYSDKQRTNKIVLALEMFKAADQKLIDAYLAGKLPEAEFLEKVNYEAAWGFPWKNFKMVLDFAATRGMPVIGINSANAGKDDLATRDKFAAGELLDAAERWPDHRIVTLIGEYHLADQHLPKALSLALKKRKIAGGAAVVRVLNNVDPYYFQLQAQIALASTEYLKLKKDFYCIMNSPPWMKWHSFSMWEEMRHAGQAQPDDSEGGSGEADQDNELDMDLHTEDTFDVEWQFMQFVHSVATFLRLKLDENDVENFHVHFAPDGDFLEQLTSDGEVEEKVAQKVVERASMDGVYFLAKSKRVLLTQVSINNLAEGAGQYLHTLASGFDDSTPDDADRFLRKVLKSAVGMIASKVLNPRRKCLELRHYRQLLKRAKADAHRPAANLRLETVEALVKFDQWMRGRIGGADVPPPFASVPKSFLEADEATAYELSREIGKLLGYSLYKQVLASKEPPTRIKRLFRRKIDGAPAAWHEVAGLYKMVLG